MLNLGPGSYKKVVRLISCYDFRGSNFKMASAFSQRLALPHHHLLYDVQVFIFYKLVKSSPQLNLS